MLAGGWSAVSSSNVRAVRYEAKTQRLFVDFKNVSGYYDGVPLSVAAALAEAPSAGKFVWQVLRGGQVKGGPYRWVRSGVALWA